MILVVVGATYAYFTAQGGDAINTNVNVQTATTDNLSFQVGSAISLTANQEDFGSGMGNKSGETFARATLTANNSTNNATRNYYVYLDITSNDFEYTTVDEQVELLLKVTDPDGTEVTTLGNLERKTSGGETGFDITESTGLITIADNYEITSTGTVTQDWNIEVIFANLNSDQNANTGKSFSASLIIREDKIPTTVADVCPDGGNLASCIAKLNTEAGDGIAGIYYHDDDLANGAQDNSYRYSGANPNNYVCFGSDEGSCPADNLYRIIGVFNSQVKLIKADYTTSTALGTDGDYSTSTYTASSYPNYSGSLTTINRYYWNNNTEINTWSESELNTVNLNTNYLNSLGSEWSDLIAETTWQVGGGTYDNLEYSNAQTAYNYEIGANSANTTYSAKIGLMYVSDYYYGASPTYWSYPGYTTSSHPNTDGNYGADYDYRAAINDNWMYMRIPEWTISHNSDYSYRAFYVSSIGIVDGNGGVLSNVPAVRPSFYLESIVEIFGGDGTQENPFRIVV